MRTVHATGGEGAVVACGVVLLLVGVMSVLGGDELPTSKAAQAEAASVPVAEAPEWTVCENGGMVNGWDNWCPCVSEECQQTYPRCSRMQRCCIDHCVEQANECDWGIEDLAACIDVCQDKYDLCDEYGEASTCQLCW